MRHLRRSNMLYLGRYHKLQMNNPQQEEEEEVEAEEAEVEVEAEVVEDYLDRTDLQECYSRSKGSKHTVLEEVAVVVVDIQDMDY